MRLGVELAIWGLRLTVAARTEPAPLRTQVLRPNTVPQALCPCCTRGELVIADEVRGERSCSLCDAYVRNRGRVVHHGKACICR